MAFYGFSSSDRYYASVLLQNGADYTVQNTEGQTPFDVADPVCKSILKGTIPKVVTLFPTFYGPMKYLPGDYKKQEMLEASRNGSEEKLQLLLTPLNVNCHALDGRKSTPLHLAAGYNRTRVVQLLLKYGADVHAKDKGYVYTVHCTQYILH